MGPMSNDWRPSKGRRGHGEEEDHVKVGAESRGTQPHAAECLEPEGAGSSGGGRAAASVRRAAPSARALRLRTPLYPATLA